MPKPYESLSFNGSPTPLLSSPTNLLFWINSIVPFINSALPAVDLSVNTVAYLFLVKSLKTIAELIG
jgi:hypothetical protein